ncbi:MAG: hypothetical protein ND866_13140 [Pyrinomonadaceae bacterium]|nr:hypothetical protein [Pyrinomonadaceae bacterium]
MTELLVTPKLTMNGQIRIEIIGRDAFWRKAVLVEWNHQYPERELVAQSSVCYLIETEWLVDLKRVAEGCFSKIIVAPEDPSRRLWLSRFIPTQSDNQP